MTELCSWRGIGGGGGGGGAGGGGALWRMDLIRRPRLVNEEHGDSGGNKTTSMTRTFYNHKHRSDLWRRTICTIQDKLAQGSIEVVMMMMMMMMIMQWAYWTYWIYAESQSAAPGPSTSPCHSACHSPSPHQAASQANPSRTLTLFVGPMYSIACWAV